MANWQWNSHWMHQCRYSHFITFLLVYRKTFRLFACLLACLKKCWPRCMRRANQKMLWSTVLSKTFAEIFARSTLYSHSFFLLSTLAIITIYWHRCSFQRHTIFNMRHRFRYCICVCLQFLFFLCFCFVRCCCCCCCWLWKCVFSWILHDSERILIRFSRAFFSSLEKLCRYLSIFPLYLALSDFPTVIALFQVVNTKCVYICTHKCTCL